MKERLWQLVKRYTFDVLILGGAIGVVLELALSGGGKDTPTHSLWILIPGSLAIFLPLFARRRAPFAAPTVVFAVAVAMSFVDSQLLPFSFFLFLAVLAGCFLYGALPDRRQSLAGLAIAIAALLIVIQNDPSSSPGDYVFIGVVFGAVWAAGWALGYKLQQAAAAEERATQLERERELRAREAVAEERARIARELHDVVGHSVSVMTVQAGGVRRLLKPEQEREREALEIIEQTGREALAEMRRLVGVLRRPEESPALAPQPSLEHLDRLVAKARESGLPVELRVEGEPTQLPPGLDLTAYRLVQEGLTNALKHARASKADVLVRYGDGEVEISVTDDGSGDGGGDSGGHGLVGMRERVSVYGGEIESGPLPGGGYGLRARLPLG
jgi:signal transduction histidine kinase